MKNLELKQGLVQTIGLIALGVMIVCSVIDWYFEQKMVEQKTVSLGDKKEEDA